MTTQTPKPIELGQTYRPSEANRIRPPEDRITVTRVWTPDGKSEQSIAYDVATVDYRNRPITTHSALAESVFRKSYVLDAPELSPADIVEQAIDLLDRLDTVTYTIVTPATADTIDVKGRTRGMAVAHGVEGLRSLADAMAIREAQRRTEALATLRSRRGMTCAGVYVDEIGSMLPTAEEQAARVVEEALAPLRTAVSGTREQQRAKAKAQVLREVADDIKSRNDGCNVAGVCDRCGARVVEADRLRRQAADIEAAANADRCTCGVPTDPTAVHRTDAPCYVKDTDQ